MKRKILQLKGALYLLCLFLIFGHLPELLAQDVQIVSVTPPPRVNVCGNGIDKDGVASTVVINTKLLNGATGTFKVNLPVGFFYIAGTNTGSGYSEFNISNLNEPIFATSNSTFTNLSFKISADCNTTATKTITATATTGGSTITSNPIANVDEPNILQLSWTNDQIDGLCVGSTYTRTVTIKNGDLGYASKFLFKSTNDVNSVQVLSTSIVSPINQVLVPTVSGNTQEFLINGAVFPAGALGTSVFEDQETITISQTVKVIGCGNLTGNFETVFGCGATPNCQLTTHNTVINIGTGVPDISITRLDNNLFPVCTAATSEATVTYEIKNTGTGTCAAFTFDYLRAFYGNHWAGGFGTITEVKLFDGNGLNVPFTRNNTSDPGTSNSEALLNFTGFTSDPDGAGGFADVNGDGIFNEIPIGSSIKLYLKVSIPNYFNTCPTTKLSEFLGFNYRLKTLCGQVYTLQISPDSQAGLSYVRDGAITQVSGPSDLSNGDFGLIKGNLFSNTLGYACPNPIVKMKVILPKGYVYDASNPAYPFSSGLGLTNPTVVAGIAPAPDVLYFDMSNAAYIDGKFQIPIRFDCSLFGGDASPVKVSFENQCTTGCDKMLLACYDYPITPHCPVSCPYLAIVSHKVERTTLGYTDATFTTLVNPAVVNNDSDPTNNIDVNSASPCDIIRMSSLSNATPTPFTSTSTILYTVSVPALGGSNPLVWTGGDYNFNAPTAGVARGTLPAPSVALVGSNYVFTFDLTSSLASFQNVASTKLEVYPTFKIASLGYSNTTAQNFNPRAAFVVDGVVCDSYGDNLYLAKTKLENFNTTINISGCTNSNLHQDYFFTSPINYTNEFRNLMQLDRFVINLPAGITYSGGATFTNGAPNYTFLPLNATQVGTTLTLTPVPGAGQYVSATGTPQLNIPITASCNTVANSNPPLLIYQSTNTQQPDPACYNQNLQYNGAFFNFTKPSIVINNSNTTITTNPFSWTFTVSNSSTVELKNLFLNFENSTGLQYVSLEDITGGGSIAIPLATSTGANVWTNTGAAASMAGLTTRTFKLTAKVNNCNANNNVIVKGGWDCVSLPTSPSAYTCEMVSANLVSNVANTGLSISVTAPSSAQDLCNPIQISSVLRTTDLGHAYLDKVSTNLPAGLNFLGGSAEYEYPSGSGVWLPLTPIVAAQTLTFDLASAIGPNGLYGTADAINGNDKIGIRFNTQATCNFTSGSRLAFTGLGTSACGVLINSKTQYSGNVNIGGIPPTLNNYVITQTIEDATNCELKSIRNMTLSITNPNATPTDGAKEAIQVTLPAGAIYVPSSATNPNCGVYLSNPTSIQAAATGDILKWDMPSGVGQNGVMCVNYKITLPDNCDEKLVSTSTIFKVPVSCNGPLGAFSCTDLNAVTTNDIKTFVTPLRPSWNLNSFAFTYAPTALSNVKTVNVSGDFTNISSNPLPVGESVSVDFYWDTNCDGIGDTYITGSTKTYTGIIDANANTLLSNNFTADVTGHGTHCIVAKIQRSSESGSNISCTCNSTSLKSIAPLLVSVSGNVFNDPNATNVNNSSGDANLVPAGMTAILVGSDGNVVANATVGTDGVYTFGNVTPGDYTVVLSTTAGTVGAVPPAPSLPAGWNNTGEFTGTPNTGTDASVNGTAVTFTVVATDVVNVNFGIQEPPTANIVVIPPVVNPGGTVTTDITTSFGGTDPTTNGIVTAIKITEFPTATATSITIDGVVYTDLASITTAYPNGIPTDANGVPTVSIKIDPKDGAQTVVIPYVTIDNAGVESPIPGSVTASYTVVSVSGNVFNDPNATNVNNSSGDANLVPAGMTAILVGSDGKVVANTTVGTDGVYNFGNVTPGDYTVVLSTTAGTVGAVPPAPSLPAGWNNTGEFTGTPDSGTDASVNGTAVSFTVVATDIVNVNFGIQEPPTANVVVIPPVVNPGGTVTTDITTSFGGTDPTTNGIVTTLKITSFPSTATSITIDGVVYTDLPSITAAYPNGIPTDANGVPTVAILIDPKDGAQTVVIPYVTIDNAGVESPIPGSVTASFTVVSVSGNVFNDPNATNVNNSSGDANLVPAGMTAILVGSDGKVVANATVGTDGVYTFGNVTPGDYTVVLSTTAGTVGAVPPAPSLPAGWNNTGEFTGTPNTGTDASVNGTAVTFTVVATDVVNVNFGIQEPPTANIVVIPPVVNPGGTVTTDITTSFGGTDPTTNGIVTAIKITAFPSTATSITIDGVVYTDLASITTAYPNGIPTDANGVPTVSIKIDPKDGAQTVVIPYVTIDNAGVESPIPGSVTASFTVVSVSGNVFNDPNATNVNNSSGDANLVPAGMTAILVGSDGKVVANATVGTDGVYTFGNVTPGDYTVVLSTTAGTVGAVPPAPSLPAGWNNTGEFTGTPDSGTDASVNGTAVTFTVVATDVVNVNFGIQEPPTANIVVIPPVVNPGGTVTTDITTSFGGTDPTTNGIVTAIKITEFPTATATSITIDGVVYTDLASITTAYPNGIPTDANGVPTVSIKIDPKDGAQTVVIPYVTIDNAGVESPIPGSVTASFTVVSVSGNVFNDPNATNVNNSSGDANLVPAGMTAILVGSDGKVVANATVGTDGVYTFGNVTPGDYTVVLSTTAGTVGAVPPAPSLPAGWNNTGEFTGTPNTGTDASVNGTAVTFTVVATDVVNVNFGIQEPPTANIVVIPPVVNPGGTVTTDITTSFGGTDPTTNGIVTAIKITAFPTATATSITINGVIYTDLASITTAYPNGIPTDANGVPTVSIKIDPKDGSQTVVIPYVTIDNAGVESPIPGSVTASFTLPLPVDLLSFTGKQIDKQINLTWKTANEKNFSHFEVQKSQDAKEFGGLAVVKGNNANIYNTIDINPIEGINYYRLKMVDMDGTSKLSNIISITFEKSADFVTVENPANGNSIMVETNLKTPKFTLVNGIGKQMSFTSFNIESNKFRLDISNYTPGIYYLNINSNGKMITKKVLMY